MEEVKRLSVSEMEAQLAKRLYEIEQRRKEADMELAQRRAEHQAELDKERAAIDDYHRSREAEFLRRKNEMRLEEEKRVQEENKRKQQQEQEANLLEEQAKKDKIRMEAIRQRMDEMEVLEEQLRKSYAEKLSNPNVPTMQGEPSPEEMSSHLRKLLHMNNRESVGLERPEQYQETL